MHLFHFWGHFAYLLCYYWTEIIVGCSEKGYGAYQLKGNDSLLFRPFENIYFGAAYLIWLSSFDQK